MPRPPISVPTYREYKPTGMALSDFRDPVTGAKRCVTLGPWQSPQSRKEHARLCSELATGKSVGSSGLSVAELALAYLVYAEGYYVKNGQPTDEVDAVRSALRALRLTHGHMAVGEFTPRALVAVQNHMIDLGWCRRTINKQLARVRRVFKWGASEGLVGSQHGGVGARKRPPPRFVFQIRHQFTSEAARMTNCNHTFTGACGKEKKPGRRDRTNRG